MKGSDLPVPFESSIDQGPYVKVAEDGRVAAIGNTQDSEAEDTCCNGDKDDVVNGEETTSKGEQSDHKVEKTNSN